MKKCFILLFFSAAVYVAAAQDTVKYPDRWYGYTYRNALWECVNQDSARWTYDPYVDNYYSESNFIFFDTVFEFQSYHMDSVPSRHGEWLRFLEPKRTQRIYGLAVTMDEVDFDTLDANLIIYYGVSMHLESQHFLFNNSYCGTIDSIAVIPMRNPPLMKHCVFEYDYSLPTPWSRYSNCYEIYFNNPIDVQLDDSIMYGIQRFGFNFATLNVGRDTSHNQALYSAAPNFVYQELSNYTITNIRAQHYWKNFDGNWAPYYTWPGFEHAYWHDSYWGGIFPIVSPRCTAPKNLRVHRGNSAKDTVVWRSDIESDVFQLSLTGYSANPSTGEMFTMSDTSFVLPGFQADTVLMAYVRKMCTFEFATHTDTVWGDWAGPVLVHGDTTGFGGGNDDSLGIATPERPGLSVSPNPAHNVATVYSTARMTQVEAYNATGALVLRRSVDGNLATLNIASWPRGTYVVRITTHADVRTAKLIVR